ncbi:MAG: hypothetical protein IPF56_11590 [Chloroflexi bacterium]|nr:hypothetical protein [Chloroflexota bacterium]
MRFIGPQLRPGGGEQRGAACFIHNQQFVVVVVVQVQGNQVVEPRGRRILPVRHNFVLSVANCGGANLGDDGEQ